MAHEITRRDFLKLGVAGAAIAVLAGCENPRRWVVLEPYVKPPEEQLAGQATWYASTCRQCPAGCGILVRIMNGRALKIEGNPEHPLNRGKLCARGQASLQVLYNPDRLSGPAQRSARGSRQFKAVTWNEGLNTVLTRLQAAGQRVAIWSGSTTSGHLSDLFQRFTSAIGAPAPIVFDLYTAYHGYHLMQSTNQRVFGQPHLPAYDLQQVDLILSFGADFLSTWLSSTRYGVEFGQFRKQPLGKRGYLVQLEPRMSITGAKSDRWIPLRPGSEGSIAQAIARLIADRAYGSPDRVGRARALAGNVDVNAVAQAAEVSVADLEQLARLFGTTDRVVAIPGSSLTGQANAEAAVAAVEALNVIAGVSRPSMEQAASATSHFVHSPVSSFADVQSLIARMKAGEVQALLVYGANPAYDLPPEAGFLDALSHVPFVVSFAPMVDETTAWADVILPDHTPFEAWGYDVVEPLFDSLAISSQQPVVTPYYDTRATGDVLLTIAHGLPAAAAALPWSDEVEFLKEQVAQLSGGSIEGSTADVKWARFLQHGGWWTQTTSTSASTAGNLQPIALTPAQFEGDQQAYPFYLHVSMNDLLSDGRGANQPWLQGSPDVMTTIAWQTWVEMNPLTAQKIGVQDGDVVRVASPHGAIEAPVYVYPAIRPDTVAIPLGQGHTDYGRYARNRGSNVMQLVGAQTDSSGQYLTWSRLRVSVTPTGQKVAQAKFESTVGVTEGFINQAFPGQ